MAKRPQKMNDIINFFYKDGNLPGEILEERIAAVWKYYDKKTTSVFYPNDSLVASDADQDIAYINQLEKGDFFRDSYNAYVCYMIGTMPYRGSDIVMEHVTLQKIMADLYTLNTIENLCSEILFSGCIARFPELQSREYRTSFFTLMNADDTFIDDVLNVTEEREIEKNKLLLFIFSKLSFNDIYIIQKKSGSDEANFDIAGWVIQDRWKNYNELLWNKYKYDSYLDIAKIEKLENTLAKNQAIYQTLIPGIKEKWYEQTPLPAPAIGLVKDKKGKPVYYFQGEAIGTWIKEDLSSKFKDKYSITLIPAVVDGSPPTKIETSKEKAGCIVKGTKILMSDFSEKSIENICCDDLVLNKTLCSSICSEELIKNDAVEHIYSVNEDVPFMSLEHAVFVKNKGWCSLNPQSSNLINPRWKIKLLEVQDEILKINEVNELYYEIVKKINIEKNNQCCYDLHFYEGSQSYFANGYACLLNYPQFTLTEIIQKLKRNKSLNINSDQLFAILKMILAPNLFDYVKKELDKQ